MSFDTRSAGDSATPVALEALIFRGSPGEDVTDFLGDVKRVAIVQGRQRDEEWMIDYVESCLRGDAMTWFDSLSVTNWRSLRSLFLQRFAAAATRPLAQVGTYAPPANVPPPPGVFIPGSAPTYHAQWSEPPLPSAFIPTTGRLSDKASSSSITPTLGSALTLVHQNRSQTILLGDSGTELDWSLLRSCLLIDFLWDLAPS